MSTFSVNLPAAVHDLARARAAEQGFQSVDAYLATLIEADAAVPVSDALEAEILAGLGSPAREMTPRDWDEMRQRFGASRAPAGAP